MARRKMSRFSRLSASSHKRAGVVLPIIISVSAFLVLSIVISVAVGLLLGGRADEIKDEKRFDFEKVEYISGNKTVKGVEAYHFPTDASPADYVSQDIWDLSVMVRDSDGDLQLSFDTAELFPIDKVEGEHSFDTLCADSERAGARVCAYMYVNSLSIEEKYARDAAMAYEIALIAEMASSGADDILLLGIEVNEDNISEVREYASRASIAADKTPLGVALSPDVYYLAEQEIYLAGMVRDACDYLAVDLTYMTLDDGKSGKDADGEEIPSVLEETIDRLKFYIAEYPARLLFSREHHRLYVDAAHLGVVDYQIVDK